MTLNQDTEIQKKKYSAFICQTSQRNQLISMQFNYIEDETAFKAQSSHYGIPCGTPLKLANIMVLIFYTDFSIIISF